MASAALTALRRPLSATRAQPTTLTSGRRAVCGRPLLREHEIGDARRDLGAEARAVEHAVVADAELQIMRLALRRNVDAQPVRGLGLADAGNVVVLAFDGEQRGVADLARIDRPAAVRHLALRQRVAHEHGLDGLQIELGGEVHHREIFVVELAMLLRRIAVALDQMEEQIAVRIDMAVEVHADEAVELQEARIDVAHDAGMRERHLGDDVAAEPVDAALLRQLVDAGRIAARVDRAAHQHDRARRVGIVVGLHQRGRRQHRHRRLAHRDDVAYRRRADAGC